MFMYFLYKARVSLRFIKIALCILVVYLLILSLFAGVFRSNKSAIRAKKPTNTVANQIQSLTSDKKINSSPSGKLFISAYKGIACSLIGEACYDDLNKKNPANASTFIASALAYPFLNPPASGIGATAETLAQAGLIPKSYAAEGVGFASLRPLMNIWKAMRDVAYLLLVLVIVTIGFMIMFRSKINPQTIVNAENSLPKIVMALIYITFSFAIAGFLIDLMYVSIVLIIVILGPEQTARTTPELMTTFLQGHPGTILQILLNFDFFTIFWRLPEALLAVLGDGVGQFLRLIITVSGALFLHGFVEKKTGPLTDINITGSVGVLSIEKWLPPILKFIFAPGNAIIAFALAFWLVPFILGLLIFLTVLMLFFRIFLLIFSNYIKLFVLIIISPLFLLMEALPGQSTFSSWIKSILELLVPFPVIVATFLVGTVIIESSTKGALWTPPFLFGLEAENLSTIIGVWVLFMIPEFVGIVQKAVNPKPLPLDAGIGTFFGGAKTGVETGLGEMSKYALLANNFAPLGRVFDMIPGFKRQKQ